MDALGVLKSRHYGAAADAQHSRQSAKYVAFVALEMDTIRFTFEHRHIRNIRHTLWSSIVW